MIYTPNFDKQFNAKKVAAFVGVAPYQNSSRTSVDKGTHVSNFAHTILKTLLHTASMSALNHNPFIKKHYKRKKAEGKKRFLVMNNAKNKLIIAVISSETPVGTDFQHPKMAD